jgi:hypothetical protein
MTTKKPTKATVRKQVHMAQMRARAKQGRPAGERTEAAVELLARRMAEYEARIARLEQLAMAVHAVEGQAVDVGPVAT